MLLTDTSGPRPTADRRSLPHLPRAG